MRNSAITRNIFTRTLAMDGFYVLYEYCLTWRHEILVSTEIPPVVRAMTNVTISIPLAATEAGQLEKLGSSTPHTVTINRFIAIPIGLINLCRSHVYQFLAAFQEPQVQESG